MGEEISMQDTNTTKMLLRRPLSIKRLVILLFKTLVCVSVFLSFEIINFTKN